MLFKYAFIAALGFIFYKMVFPAKKIGTSETDQEVEEEYTDYEELD